MGGTMAAPTVEKILCRSFIVSVLQISPCFLRGNGEIHKRVETVGVYPLVPLPGRQDSVSLRKRKFHVLRQIYRLCTISCGLPPSVQLLPNRGKHPFRHIQIPADLQLINLKRQVGWIPRLNI